MPIKLASLLYYITCQMSNVITIFQAEVDRWPGLCRRPVEDEDVPKKAPEPSRRPGLDVQVVNGWGTG